MFRTAGLTAGATLAAAMMARALRLAGRGLYTASPNPRVGCVIVKNGTVIGEGYHHRAGTPHAEVHALRAAGAAARGADAYVTLEPCSHFGKTPPCADALIDAGVARVIAAMPDPNPKVSGSGFARLRAAGIACEVGLMGSTAEALNIGFVSRMTRGRPWLRSKLASSFDGRTAMASGESRWITGAAARRDVQRLRARADAVLTGVGTVLADDPALNLRAAELGDELPADITQPMRVIVDSGLRTPPGSRIFTLPGSVLVATCTAANPAALRAAGAEIVVLPETNGRVNLPALCQALALRGVNEVHVEAGPVLNGALLSAGLLDELVCYTAPKIMGDGARGLFHLPGLTRMADCIDLLLTDARMVGDDLRITARPR